MEQKDFSPPYDVHTWASTNDERAPVLNPRPIMNEVPKDFIPFAGTVSHHLLAGEVIDEWFHALSQKRNVKTFFIISPSHYGLSTYSWSLANCSWDCGNVKVATNAKVEKAIAQALGVEYEERVFSIEHGVSTLIPYIAKYFPKATVCAIAVKGEPPLNQVDAEKLYCALKPYFTKREQEKNFLLISTDFSHHGNIEQTTITDNRSALFFENPSSSSWIYCGCDNRPCMYVLASFLSEKAKAHIFCHTNSYELSGFSVDTDITSYFFSFFIM